MRSVATQDKKTAIATLERGGILAVPTETVYGLAVRADNHEAINKLLTLKDRQVGSGKILTMMVADVDSMKKYAEMDLKTINFARHYFPGELTVLLPKHHDFKHKYFDNFSKIGIRIPQHEYMLDLLKETGPLLVTSANLRGEAPCYHSKDVKKRLPSIDAVIEGSAGGNIPSTIIDLCGEQPRVIRQGGLLVVKY